MSTRSSHLGTRICERAALRQSRGALRHGRGEVDQSLVHGPRPRTRALTTANPILHVSRLADQIEAVRSAANHSCAERSRPYTPAAPHRLVPPITAAAIDSSSSVPPPVCVLAACRRAVEIRPPTAAKVPASAKTQMRTRATSTPARRAASAWPIGRQTVRRFTARRAACQRSFIPRHGPGAQGAGEASPAQGHGRAECPFAGAAR